MSCLVFGCVQQLATIEVGRVFDNEVNCHSDRLSHLMSCTQRCSCVGTIKRVVRLSGSGNKRDLNVFQFLDVKRRRGGSQLEIKIEIK